MNKSVIFGTVCGALAVAGFCVDLVSDVDGNGLALGSAVLVCGFLGGLFSAGGDA